MQNKVLYQWEKFIDKTKPEKNIDDWNSSFGPKVIERDEKGFSKKVQFRVFVDNSKVKIYIVGDFNDWEQNENFELKSEDEHGLFYSIILDNISHKTKYKFLVVDNNGKSFFYQDPAGVYFDDVGNTIFWDFKSPDSYKQKYSFINTINRSTKILQTDLPGLISHFKSKITNQLGSDIDQEKYYDFITESGIIEYIRNLGYNTIQFLPFAQSIDGDNWKYRYLVPFQFAIQKNWGNPDDFARMIDEFHKNDIAVIGDFVIGHVPYKDYKIFGQDSKHNGIHVWGKENKFKTYVHEETNWGTIRPDYDNEYVRDFFISSCLHFQKYYKIDGFRIDNVDGVIRHGINGDGDERPNGRTFLRKLNQKLYSYNQFTLIHYEAHYFYGDNAKMLVIPFDDDQRALGATAYNESRLTYFLHKDFMLKPAGDFSVWKFKELIDEKEWGQSNSTVSDFHNHDAAAGLMDMRCTGSYAYDAMTVKRPENHIHALGKIKVMEVIIAFLQEGRILDLPQTFLLQTGTFEHESAIAWELTYNEVNKNVLNFKTKINQIMDDPAFWPINVKNRNFLNLDEKNKVIVFERFSDTSRYVIVINIASFRHHNYKVGVKTENDYEVVFNSDEFKYAGFGFASYSKNLENKKSINFELLEREIELSTLAPYGIVVLKEIKS